MKTAIIQAHWMRQDKFRTTIEDLNKQTSKNFDLFIWNNRNDIVPNTQLEMLASGSDGYQVYVHTSAQNILGFGRMVMANTILNNKLDKVDGSIYDKIIFIDDDQRFAPEFHQYMVDSFKLRTYLGRWAYTIQNDDYWSRLRCYTDMPANYVGTCGAIIDPSIFIDTGFMRYYNYNPLTYWLEDAALSLYCKKIGWSVEGLDDKYIVTKDIDKFEQSQKTNAVQMKRDGWKKLKEHYDNLKI